MITIHRKSFCSTFGSRSVPHNHRSFEVDRNGVTSEYLKSICTDLLKDLYAPDDVCSVDYKVNRGPIPGEEYGTILDLDNLSIPDETTELTCLVSVSHLNKETLTDSKCTIASSLWIPNDNQESDEEIDGKLITTGGAVFNVDIDGNILPRFAEITTHHARQLFQIHHPGVPLEHIDVISQQSNVYYGDGVCETYEGLPAEIRNGTFIDYTVVCHAKRTE